MGLFFRSASLMDDGTIWINASRCLKSGNAFLSLNVTWVSDFASTESMKSSIEMYSEPVAVVRW